MDKYFIYNSYNKYDLNLRPTNMFQSYCTLVIKGTLWLKYEPDWAKERDNKLRTAISDGQPYRKKNANEQIARPTSGALIKRNYKNNTN